MRGAEKGNSALQKYFLSKGRKMMVRIRTIRSGKVCWSSLSLFVIDGDDELKKIFNLIKSIDMLVITLKSTFCKCKGI